MLVAGDDAPLVVGYAGRQGIHGVGSAFRRVIGLTGDDLYVCHLHLFVYPSWIEIADTGG